MPAQSAVSAVIDWLVEHLPAAVQSVDPDGVVAEGIPLVQAPTWLLIGSNGEGPAPVAIDAEYRHAGGRRVTETVSIPCLIQCSTGEADQGIARRRALAVLGAVRALIVSDPSLGGLIDASVAQITGVTYTATGDPSDVARGRRADVELSIRYESTYVIP